MPKNKYSREGFEVDSVIVTKVENETFKQDFRIKVNSLDLKDIQPVIDYWRNFWKKDCESRKLVVKNIYKVEKMPKNLGR